MSLPYLQALSKLARHLCRFPEVPRRIGFLGYPDLVLEPEVLAQVVGAGAMERLEYRANAERLRAIHGAPPHHVVPTVESFFACISSEPMEIEILDFQSYTGQEKLLDLNLPLPEEMEGRYGLLVDHGTLEHVFNVAQAFRNCAGMVAVGGYVLHSLPTNAFNHGFWNINPTALVEFHEANGFETSLLKLQQWHARSVREAPPFARFRMDTQQETNVFYIGRRAEPRAAFLDPIQRRYQDPSVWV